MQHPQTLTIHQLSRSLISPNPSTPNPLQLIYPPKPTSPSTPSSSTNRAYRTFKRKFPNTPFQSNPGTSTTYINHPLHTNTKEFLQICLPFFPQYTYFHSDPNDEKPNYVDEHVLYPTLSWTSYYHFTNSLTLPLYNTSHNNEVGSTLLYLLTTALTPHQFTQIRYRESLTKFTAPKANNYSIDYYDHNIIRPNEDICLLGDPYTNPQLTEKFFIKTSYTFTLNILNKKYDKAICAALHITNAYESYFKKFNHFSLTFQFLAPKNVICTVHTKSCYELNKHIRITLTIHHHDNLTIDFNTHHRFSLTSPIVLKTQTYKAPSEIMTLSPRCISSAH